MRQRATQNRPMSQEPPAHSPDANDGLIYAWHIDGPEGQQPLDWKDLPPATKRDALYWMHLDFEHPTVVKWLREQSSLDHALLDYLIADDSRPGVFFHGNRLVMIMRGINTNVNAEPEDLISLRLCLSPDRLLTFCRRRVQTMEEIHQSYQLGSGPLNPGDFVVDVITREVDRIGDHIEEIEEETLKMEMRLLNADDDGISDSLQALQLDLIDLRRYLHPQRSMLSRLLESHLEWLSEANYNRIRAQAEFHTSHVEDVDYCLQRAQLISERLDNRQNEDLNQKLYILAIVSCVFLPLSLITGLLGVNLSGIPYSKEPHGFTILTLTLFAIAGIILVYFKRKKWF